MTRHWHKLETKLGPKSYLGEPPTLHRTRMGWCLEQQLAVCSQSKWVLSQRNSEPSIPWYFSLSNILRQSLPVSFYFKNSLGFQNSRKLLCSCVTERHYTIITFALIGQHTAASRWVLTLEKKIRANNVSDGLHGIESSYWYVPG